MPNGVLGYWLSDHDPNQWSLAMLLKRVKMESRFLAPMARLPKPALWLSADYGVTISDIDRVDSWKSIVNTTHNFVNTGNNRPTWVESGIGSRPSLAFDIAEERYLNYAGQGIGPGVAGTFCCVVSFANAATAQTVYAQSVGSLSTTRYARLTRAATTGTCQYLSSVLTNETAATATTEAALTHSTTYILTLTTSGNSDTAIRFSGSAQNVTDTGVRFFRTASNQDYSTIGARRAGDAYGLFCGGHVSEMLAYTQVLSARKLGIIERYLATKYGVTLA